MKKQWIRQAGTAVLAVALLFPIGQFPTAASAAAAEVTSVYQPQAFPAISLTGSSYMKLKEVLLLEKEEGKRTAFTFTVYNGDSKSLAFRDFFIRLESKSGKSLIPVLLSEHRNQTSIAPGESAQFRYYAELPETVELQDLVFKVMKWDFSLPDYERQLGQFTVGADYSPVVPAGSAALVQVTGVPVQMEVTETNTMEDNSSRLVTIKLALNNEGTHSVQIPSYTFALQSGDGAVYPLAAESLEGLGIDARDKKELTLTGKLPQSVSLPNWKLIITEILPNDKNAELPAAEFDLPQAGAVRTAEGGEPLELVISDQLAKVAVTGADMDLFYGKYAADISVAWENKGSVKLALPSYVYLLRTSDGQTYPLTASAAGADILPQSVLNLGLSASSIPVSVSTEGLRLEIYEPNVSVTGLNAPPLAVFPLRGVTPTHGEEADSRVFKDIAGHSYQVRMNGIQRLPWEDQDIIAADFTITNTGEETIANPKLNGQIVLDGVSVEAEQLTAADLGGVNSLSPGEQRSMVVYTKIPYRQQVKEAAVAVKDTDTGDRITVRSDAGAWSVPVSAATTAGIGEAGAQTSMKPAAVKVYEGSAMNLVYAEMDVQNLENRSVATGQWSGQIKTADGVYFPAQLSAPTQKISPQGHALVGFWSLVPKRYASDKLELVVGEGLTGTALTKQGQTPDAFAKAIRFTLPKTEAAVQLKQAAVLEVDSQPYHFSVRDMSLSYTYNQATGYKIDFIFRYDLEKNADYEAVGGDRKLVLKLMDFDPVVEKEFVLETALSSGTEALSLGTNLKKTVTVTTVDWFFFSKNELRVYERFEGYDRLLGSIEF